MTNFSNPLARWNERFSMDAYLFGESPNRYLAEKTPLLQKGKALCIADGEGRNSVWLASQGFAVDAFDFSPIAIAKAKKLAEKQNVQVDFHCSSWESFEWKANCYDTIAGIFFQFADPGPRTALFAKLNLALKPGGTLVLQGYGKEQMKYKTGGPGILENLYDEELLLSSFPGYKIMDLHTYTQEVDEGPGHSGMSALVGFVGQKP
ncbi:MAG: class I SAM-dependent methyltransferase [Betaproteobacteria bacterium]|jgi:SAM-dependent methyltransferase|nr:class I SAM-dependent methyltransferase [Burkholderiales bacterium]NBX89203.1 class I SAM-dependent methyltransferase [Betaproteobacteria bacterium]